MKPDNCCLHVAETSFLVEYFGARTMADEGFMHLKVHVRVHFSFMALKMLCKYLHIIAISAALIDGV